MEIIAPLRRLDVLVSYEYASAKLLEIFDRDLALEQMREVLHCAREIGMGDFLSGGVRDDSPLMFRDEPLLVRAWHEGWDDQCLM